MHTSGKIYTKVLTIVVHCRKIVIFALTSVLSQVFKVFSIGYCLHKILCVNSSNKKIIKLLKEIKQDQPGIPESEVVNPTHCVSFPKLSACGQTR